MLLRKVCLTFAVTGSYSTHTCFSFRSLGAATTLQLLVQLRLTLICLSNHVSLVLLMLRIEPLVLSTRGCSRNTCEVYGWGTDEADGWEEAHSLSPIRDSCLCGLCLCISSTCPAHALVLLTNRSISWGWGFVIGRGPTSFMQICLLPIGAKTKPLFSLTLYPIETVSNVGSTTSLGCFQFSQGSPLDKWLDTQHSWRRW